MLSGSDLWCFPDKKTCYLLLDIIHAKLAPAGKFLFASLNSVQFIFIKKEGRKKGQKEGRKAKVNSAPRFIA